MGVEQDEVYERWELELPAAPPRSKLYCLTPFGVGTAQVEGLTGYLMRLAEAHHVEWGVLAELVGAYLPTPCQYRLPGLSAQRLCERWRDLSKIEVTLKDWVWAIEKLTLRIDLRELTMLEWADLIDLRSVYQSLRVWCPFCYEEWSVTGRPIYEPLLWNIKEVTVCLRHRRLLLRTCSYCNQLQSLIIGTSRVGHCGLCGLWLGASEEAGALSGWSTEADLERQQWVTSNVGDLTSVTAALPRRLRRQQLAARLRAADRRNGRLFLTWSIDEVNAFLSGQRLPSLAFLLDLCWKLKVGLLEFLTSEE